ncbi:MAG: competence/damage-inducible protein A [Bacteroidia bacterium]
MEILCEIITIGDEILIGQIVDTNSAWMAQELNKIGIKVKQITSVSDDRIHILNSLKEAESRVDIVLITGGLGPTKDDITKKTLSEYFNKELVLNEDVLKCIKTLFSKFGREINAVQVGQAMVLKDCIVMINDNGTAPGLGIEKENKLFVSMPGVPYEMKALMEKSVIPLLKEKYKTPAIIHRTILTQGLGESYIAERIKDWENQLPIHIKLAYLPSVGGVRLRLSAIGIDKNLLSKELKIQEEKLFPLIENVVFGYDNQTLEKVILDILKIQNKKLAVAESCTGGYISHLITKVPGASSFFNGSIVSYINEVKTDSLNVNEVDIHKYSEVSETVVEQMAKGVLGKLKSDYSIATTGYAGPDGGNEENPIGSVWIAVANKEKVISRKFQLGDNRERVIERASLNALMMLRKFMLE